MALRAFWVILVGETPTSFHAKTREDLVPTLRQLQRTQSNVTLRWFERGRVWESPQQAEGVSKLAATAARERRSKEWRPGGDHRDPHARFEMTRDQKRAKFKRDQRQEREGDRPSDKPRERPHDHRPHRSAERPHGRPDRRDNRRPDRRDDRRSDRPEQRARRQDDRSESPFGPRKPRAPGTDGPRSDRKPWDRPKSPFSDRRPKRPWANERDHRPVRPKDENPFGDRPRNERRPDRRGGVKPPKRRS